VLPAATAPGNPGENRLLDQTTAEMDRLGLTHARLEPERSQLCGLAGSKFRRAQYSAHQPGIDGGQHGPPVGLALLEGAGWFQLGKLLGVGRSLRQPGGGGGAELGRDIPAP